MSSKTFSFIVIIIAVGAGVFYLGKQTPIGEEIFCTQEALLCPDGSYVGRSGEKCQFLACPNQGTFVGELSQTSDGFHLILPSPDDTLQEVTYAMPLELRVSNALRDLVGKKVIAHGEFVEGNTLAVTTLEETNGGDMTVGTLKVNETKLIGRVKVTFNRVVADSRCPIDALCIQAGFLTVNVTLQSDTDKETVDLITDTAAYAFDTFKISIEKVVPSRTADTSIAPSEYAVTFRVEPLK